MDENVADLAIEADEQLLREALKNLKAVCCPTCQGYVAATITKLEERLLRE
ncbi:hypothetical protein LCGC14_2049720 [marine sediment metagenome]|uniref:Uncharacterized protein n=1 Tax=marine sediment metagenome TaxID=412755 RepID=A0A0F9EPB8_9ZZZZ